MSKFSWEHRPQTPANAHCGVGGGATGGAPAPLPRSLASRMLDAEKKVLELILNTGFQCKTRFVGSTMVTQFPIYCFLLIPVQNSLTEGCRFLRIFKVQHTVAITPPVDTPAIGNIRRGHGNIELDTRVLNE